MNSNESNEPNKKGFSFFKKQEQTAGNEEDLGRTQETSHGLPPLTEEDINHIYDDIRIMF